MKFRHFDPRKISPIRAKMASLMRDIKLKIDHIGLKKGKNILERTVFFTKSTCIREIFFGRNGGRPLPPKKIRQIVFPQVKLIKVININTLLSSQFLNSQPQDQASWLSRQICGSRDCLGCKVSGAHIHFRFVFC